MGKRGLNKRAQLTLFVIFGVLIVVGIIALFMILPKPEILGGSSSKDPMQNIRPCISKSLQEVLPEFQETGLYFTPVEYVNYSSQTIAYHCFTTHKEKICVRNDAQSKTRIEEELKNKISEKVEKCFENFRNANSGFDIKMGSTDLSLEILPGKINIRTRKSLEISKEGEISSGYNNFDVFLNSDLWDFIVLSNEIINEEVSCNCPRESCTADLVELMKSNRDYKMTIYIGSRSEKVYTIENFINGNKLNFAVKNCFRTI